MGNRIGGTPSGGGSSSPRKHAPASSYLPAALLSLLLVCGILAAGSRWGETAWYGMFSRARGAPPPSATTLIIAPGPGEGSLDADALGRVAAALLRQGAAAVALGPAAPAGSDVPAAEPLPPGPLVISHAYSGVRPWTFPENGPPSYPAVLSRSLYPALDGPEPGLRLPMGEGLKIADTSIAEMSAASGNGAPTTGFAALPGTGAAWKAPAFIRLERGVAASLGVEAARRYLGIQSGRIAYVEGAGALFGSTRALPIDASGAALPLFHSKNGIPRLSAQPMLDGDPAPASVRGKLVFVDPGNGPEAATPAGPRSPVEVQATLAAGLLDGTLIAAPAWGPTLAVIIGILSAVLIAAALMAGIGSWAAWGFALALAALYPAAALAAFLKGSLWLPPQMPPLLVAAAWFPLALARRRFARRAAQPPAIPPAPAFDPVPLRATPARGTPQVAPRPQAERPAQPPFHSPAIPAVAPAPAAPRPRTVPRERPGVPDANGPAAPSAPTVPASPAVAAPTRPAPSQPAAAEARPAHPHPGAADSRPVPAAAPMAASEGDIERDAKGGLVRVGRYRIVRKMGFGSAGDVFEGFDPQMNRKVAIKTITRNAAQRFDRAGERFVLEARAAGSLNHPCINTIYDFGAIRDVSYMVLEYLDGVTLSQWMRGRPQPPHPREVEPWMRQIASALDYAHDHKIIHRDLKPANLMVVDHGATLKLLDFGIAKMDDVGLTQTGMTVGTPSYMSPEQLAGAKVGPASDQYAFAVVLYQLLTYRLPYIGTKIPELCNRILKNDIVPIAEANAALGGPFWEALRKAMSPAPEDRYPGCQALAAALSETMPA